MPDDLIRRCAELYAAGGMVSLPLGVMALALWYALSFRLLNLRRGSKEALEPLVRTWRRGEASGVGGALGDALAELDADGQRHAPNRGLAETSVGRVVERLHIGAGPVAAIVMVAPLLGLLGTVNGMIETFDSLASMALYTRGGGVAGGISEALFSTQMGLVVAIPGAVVGRLLVRREERLVDELEELCRIACAEETT